MDEKVKDEKLKLLGKESLKNFHDFYHIVDFLNKLLKDRNLIFGYTMEEDGSYALSVYDALAKEE